MPVQTFPFGQTPAGQAVQQFVLTAADITVKVMTFGSRVTEVHAPDRDGRSADLILGFDRLEPYTRKNPYFGATLGRYANRIAHGRFDLDGRTVQLTTNDDGNTLHGGTVGFDSVMWSAEPFGAASDCGVRLAHRSPDGADGFPGVVDATVTYTLADDGLLTMAYAATADRVTVVNLSNHCYWNLRGVGSGDALGHVVTIAADRYAPVDGQSIPTGDVAAVAGTPLDFTTATPVGQRIGQVPGGYDFNYVLRGGDEPAVTVYEPTSGRTLQIRTTQPGVQFYSGNKLDGSHVGIGGPFAKHAAVVFEPQHYPDSVHHGNFPSTVLRPGEVYRQANQYRLGTDRSD